MRTTVKSVTVTRTLRLDAYGEYDDAMDTLDTTIPSSNKPDPDPDPDPNPTTK